MLSHEQIAACATQAHDRWNASADTLNQWSDLGGNEQFLLAARAIESAVITKATNEALERAALMFDRLHDVMSTPYAAKIRAMKVPT